MEQVNHKDFIILSFKGNVYQDDADGTAIPTNHSGRPIRAVNQSKRSIIVKTMKTQ